MWVVLALTQERDLDVFGREVPLKIEWFDGMIGCLPVFETKSSAEEYANGKYDVVEVHFS